MDGKIPAAYSLHYDLLATLTSAGRMFGASRFAYEWFPYSVKPGIFLSAFPNFA